MDHNKQEGDNFTEQKLQKTSCWNPKSLNVSCLWVPIEKGSTEALHKT